VHKKLEYLYIRIITITLIKFKVENSHTKKLFRGSQGVAECLLLCLCWGGGTLIGDDEGGETI
jgi:hypothetical protein